MLFLSFFHSLAILVNRSKGRDVDIQAINTLPLAPLLPVLIHNTTFVEIVP